MRTSEEIWQNLEKNATQIKIFLPHYMWAENNNLCGKDGMIDSSGMRTRKWQNTVIEKMSLLHYLPS